MTPLADMLDDASQILELGYSSTGLEIIAQQALVQLMERLDGEIERQQVAWEPIDRAMAKATDTRYQALEIEKPKRKNYFSGSRPSILNLPVARYPAISVMADRARTDPEGLQMDHQNVFRDFLWVEIVVRAEASKTDDPEAFLVAEGATNRRALRTAEAVMQAILQEPTLGGVVSPLGQPEVTHAEPFTIKEVEKERRGESWAFQMARVDFTLKKYATVPDIQPAPSVVPPGLG